MITFLLLAVALSIPTTMDETNVGVLYSAEQQAESEVGLQMMQSNYDGSNYDGSKHDCGKAFNEVLCMNLRCVWTVDSTGDWENCISHAVAASGTEAICVDGIIDKDRDYAGKSTFQACNTQARQQGVSFVWGHGHCYVYKTRMLVRKWGGYITAGKGDWRSCNAGSFSSEEAVGESAAVEQEAFEAVAMAHTTQNGGSAGTFSLVNVLAAFGFAVTAYGAFRHYVK